MPSPGLLPPYRSGRSPSGRLRNFAAMYDEKFLAVHAYVRREGNDSEAITAVEAEYVRRWGWGAQPGPSGVQGVSGRADDQFISKDEWNRFYDTVKGSDTGGKDYYCARCGEWAGNHRAEAPPMCPTTRPGVVGLYSEHDSFATQAWFVDGTSDGTGVSTEPQPLSALLEELLG